MRTVSSIILTAVLVLWTAGFASAQNPTNLMWRQYESEHFIVYYPEGQEYTAFEALHVAEQVHSPIVNVYGPIDTKISIVIRDDEDYANGGAYFYDNKVDISATSMDYDFRSYTDWLWNVVTHELTHIYSIHQSMKGPRSIPMLYYQQFGYQEEKREDVLVGYPNVLVSYPAPLFNIPAWLAEGVAQYQVQGARFDRWDSHRDMIVRQAALNDRLMSLDEMSVFAWTGRGNEMVYNHGFSLISYIAETYGAAKLPELMKAMSSSTALTFGMACRRVLDISPDDLYAGWKASLVERATAVRDSLGTLVEGEIFRAGGYVNGFPVWSPDGSRLAYVSNRGRDYAQNACYVANLEPGGWQWKNKDNDLTDIEEDRKKALDAETDSLNRARIDSMYDGALDIAFAGGIQSAPLWLDSWNVLFNRRMPSDRYGSHWWDMYRYVINTEDPREGTRTRITHNLRGTYPDLSPDKRFLVFVKNGAGKNNLFVLDRNDNSERQLTFYDDGTRIYRPRWSPDGAQIAFTIHEADQVNIARIDRDGSGFEYLVTSAGQDRDPAWSSDGTLLYFSSDLNGIANIYRLTLSNGTVEQLTNVIGGAFAPAPSPDGTRMAFSYYGPDGYEIHMLDCDDPYRVSDAGLFAEPVNRQRKPLFSIYSPDDSEPHDIRTLDFSLMPRIFNDRGNMKFGTYLIKSEVTNQADFTFGGAISPTNRDTDLFASFEYRRFIPTVFVEMYRQTRSVDQDENFMEEYGTIIKNRTYDLNEIDFGIRYTHHDSHQFEGRLIYSRYNARLEFEHFLTGAEKHSQYYTYSQGFDLAAIYHYNEYQSARDDVINPRGGREVRIRLDHFQDFFLDDFEDVGFLKEKYKRYPYNRYFVNWVERIPIPWTAKHTLLLRGQMSLIDHKVDTFYESQLGGPTQMRGYTFYSLSGRKTVMGQLTYRFPLLYDIRRSFLTWHFNHLYAGVFADYGRAWNTDSLNFSLDGFKRDVGVELRLDAISFYNFPTMIEFSAAYGPDDTWIRQFDSDTSSYYITRDKQDPWKYYVTVLFGFAN